MKVKVDYLNQEFEFIKTRTAMNGMTVADIKDSQGYIGTVNANILQTLEGEPLKLALEKMGV